MSAVKVLINQPYSNKVLDGYVGEGNYIVVQTKFPSGLPEIVETDEDKAAILQQKGCQVLGRSSPTE